MNSVAAFGTFAICIGLTLACGSSQRPASTKAAASDSGVVDLSKPTLVAYFVVTNAEADTNDRIATVLEDFQYSLDRARRHLEGRGIQVVETYNDSIRLRWPDGRVQTYRTADSDSSRVGYHFFKPGSTPLSIGHVLTDSDLFDEAARYFGWR
jgi:hypothetical protein